MKLLGTVYKTGLKKFTFCHWSAHGRHSGYVLSHSDHFRAQSVQKIVGQHQVDVRLCIRVQAEVFVVVACKICNVIWW